MNSALLIYLPATEASDIAWLQRSGDGRITEHGILQNWQALPSLAARSHRLPCYVLCPAELSSIHHATPLGNSAAARQAMKFQIEEQLCEQPEQLHIALIVGKTGNQPLIAVAKAQMTRWHDALEAADLRVTALLPDVLALPEQTTLSDGRRRLIRNTTHMCMVDEDNFNTWCELTKTDAAALSSGAAHSVEGTDAASWLNAIAAVFQPTSGCNLLSDEFSLRSQLQRELTRWRNPIIAGVAVLSLIWLVVFLGNSTLQSKLDAYSYEVERLYRDAFPEQRRVVSPRRQMQEFLTAIGDDRERSPLLYWLQLITGGVADINGAQVDEIEFQRDPDRLRVNLRLPGYAQLDQLSSTLKDAGLAVARGTVTQAGNAITAQLDLTEAAQ